MIRDPDNAASDRRPADAGQSVDLFNTAWAHRWLLALGLLAGTGLGFLYFTKAPPVYESVGRVQLVQPSHDNLPLQGIESGTVQGPHKTLADEALVMRSEKVLREAIRLAAIAGDPIFEGASPDEIATALAASEYLQIEIAGESDQSTIFDIAYTAENPKLAWSLVQGIVDAYGAHLQAQHHDVGQETLALIQTARDEVLARLEKLEKDYDDYRQSSALIFRQGQSQSVHRDNAEKFLAERQQLILRQTQLRSLLDSARAALDAGEPMESVLYALQHSLQSRGDGVGETLEDITRTELQRIKEERQVPRSVILREEKLIPMKIEESQLIEQLGTGHPAVKSVQNRIAATEQMIKEIEITEAETQKKIEETWAIMSGGDGSTDPEAEIRNRVRLSILAHRQLLAATEQELDVVSKVYEEEIKAAREEGQAELRFERFTRDISRQQELYDKIVARLDELNIMAEAGGLKVVTLDTPKLGEKVAPKLAKSLGAGGLLGLLIAFGLAYLIDASDKSYHSAEQIADHLGLAVIGHVPAIKIAKAEAAASDSNLDPSLVTFYKSKSQDSEAFKAIRTALYFSNQGGEQKVLQVTSATPADGKSTVAANIAITVAQSGKSVLLVDCDMRRPRVQKMFGVEADRGLAWMLEEMPRNATTQDVFDRLGEVVTETEVPNLSLMGAGMRPDNPSELLSSPKFEFLLSALKEKFDMIILDSPPMLAVTDPSNVAPRVDGVILVVRVRKNVKPLAAQAARMLETLEANILGVVVNGIGSREAKGYGKYGAKEGYYNSGKSYKDGYGYTYGASYGDGAKYGEYYDDDAKSERKPMKV